MKVVSRFLLLATGVPFLALAKNDSTAKKNDARFLKKPKAPKAPKAAPAPKKSPKATQSPTSSPTSVPTQSPTSSPTSVPTGTPTTPQLTQIFYSDYYTPLEAEIYAEDDEDDYKLAQFYLDLGLIKGHSSKTETIELLQTSFTTSINFDLESDDDDVDAHMEALVFLEILAYAGCDSAAACEAAGVTPTPLIPEKVEMNGWYRDIDTEFDNDDADISIYWQDVLTSTNEAQFLLANKGTGDFFLKARFTIELDAFAYDDEHATVEVFVREWVVVAEDGNKNFVAIEADDVYTDSPTSTARY